MQNSIAEITATSPELFKDAFMMKDDMLYGIVEYAHGEEAAKELLDCLTDEKEMNYIRTMNETAERFGIKMKFIRWEEDIDSPGSFQWLVRYTN